MKIVLLILDALGIGAMPDVAVERPQDVGVHTLRTLVQNVNHLHLDNLLRLGLGNIVPTLNLGVPIPHPLASYGRCRLAHKGADSYLGHQEIMGTIPKPPMTTLMSQAADRLQEQIASRGHAVRRPLVEKPLLLVNEGIVVGDNLEADPGLNINLTVATDVVDFETSLEIGRIVRQSEKVCRVIVFGGPGIGVDDILRHVEERGNGQIGVDSPSLGVYDQRLFVRHLGYGVDPHRQAPSILSALGIPVVLIGKMADLIACPGALRDSIVPSRQVMHSLIHAYRSERKGLVAATVQETDLAAHEGDLDKLASVLKEVDEGLGVLLPEIAEGDTLIISADHGNDPRVNIGLHTREETPLLIYRKGEPARSVGTRRTLADIGASITRLFDAPPTQDGTPII